MDHHGYVERIEKLGLRYLPVEDRRTMKNVEERSKTFAKFLTETSQKRYGSTSTRFVFTEMCFLPKIAKVHSLGVMNIFETAPPPLFIGKKGGAFYPEAS